MDGVRRYVGTLLDGHADGLLAQLDVNQVKQTNGSVNEGLRGDHAKSRGGVPVLHRFRILGYGHEQCRTSTTM